ncbi:hypothetical protein GJV26_01175 [Massilia dura]|uniref:Uncharacterized protein n=1 Tax=Pseudoduganella dura TaxID=321982 RepID=A0A6I3X940_9BURK|nr:hypothetical protein [Pseudoduganella dura]MUI11110.1 hypothetical protein [Pseudoduganella dura]GGY10309.1 hypothetical protein GCM10007386_45900 [Pseudoduganella dura]
MPIYVQHEVLGRIADVFNAEAIWQAPGLALFARRPLLRDLLERCPREQRGRAATRCFSHITLRLPQEDVDDDYHLTRGNRARDLAQSLAALHQKDFGDLLGADQVRYHVTGAEDLRAGEIEVRFGHAVYLPGPDEKVLFNVGASADSAVWKPVCPVYPGQRLAVIDEGSVPGWPFGAVGKLLLINDGPDARPELQVRPKDALEYRLDEHQGYYVVTRKGDPQGARLLLKVTRAGGMQGVQPTVQPISRPATQSAAQLETRPAPPAVWQPRAMPPVRPGTPSGMPANGRQAGPVLTGPAADDQGTALPQPAAGRAGSHAGQTDATFAPGARQRLTLAALALPRLSRYRGTGAASLSIPFDRTLAVGAVAGSVLTLVVEADDTLHAATPAGRERIALPASFAPAGERSIRVLPAPPRMAERYSAIVALPVPVAVPVTQGTFGRGTPALAALRVLDVPQLLARDGSPARDGAAAPASPDRIGLSRTAFTFDAMAQGLSITRQSATQALYHLDAELRFVGAIESGTDGGAPFLLPPGHHVVAGHYVLRFDA